MTSQSRRILVSGASGLIGSAVVRAAPAHAFDAVCLVRTRNSIALDTIYWNPAKPENPAERALLEGFDAIVHLSGANVAHRWTPAYKQEIVASRVASTQALSQTLASLNRPPRVLVCASAIGIYGNRGDEILTEQSAPGSGFLAEVCTAWEAAANPARAAGIRVVHTRFGVVLDPAQGALAKMLPPFRLGLGGPLGSGRQWMSWITLHDLVRAIFFLIERSDLAGPFNFTAPTTVTNRDFTRALARAVHRPAIFPVPAAALRVLFGEFADEGLLASQRVLSEGLQNANFAFHNPSLEPALKALLG
jgi:uncharacterized protein (TIGR01777 family)